jgi:hypothetical protein
MNPPLPAILCAFAAMIPHGSNAAAPADPPAPDAPSTDAAPAVAVPVAEAASTTAAEPAPEPTATAASPPEPKAKPDASKAPPKVSVAPGKGLTVTSADDRFSVQLRARIVPRFEVNLPPAAEGEPIEPKTRANISTARLWLSGHVFNPKVQYLIQLAYAGRDYRDGAVSPLFDAYVDYKAHRDISVKVGQYFVPFDRLRTVREFALQLTDRPRPVGEFTLDRDIGITLYSDHFLADRSPVAWRLGVFGGQGTPALSTKAAGALFVGRVEVRPLGDIDDDSEGDLDNRKKPGLQLGGAVAYNLNTSRQRSTTGTTYLGGTVDYLHAAADLTFKVRGVALQAEYLYKKAGEEQILSTDADGGERTEWARSGQGWVVQGSYHHPTGIELVARGSQMFALGDTDPAWMSELDAKGNEVAVGLNWYENGHRFKVQTAWIALFRDDFGKADHTIVTQLDAMF